MATPTRVGPDPLAPQMWEQDVIPIDPPDEHARSSLPPVRPRDWPPGVPIDTPQQPAIDPRQIDARLAAAGITVRPARFRELRHVARIQREAFGRLGYSLATLISIWLLPNVRFLVAVRDGPPLGCAMGDHSGPDARVINIAVDAAARRQGIAAGMLQRLEDDLSGGDVILMVQEENDGAHTLYRRAGYIDVGTAPNYYGRGRNGIWMRKHRPPTGAPTPHR